jgi:hypothetical protein
VIRDDYDIKKNPDQRVIFEVYRSIKRAIEFLKEFGIHVTQETLYQLWRLPNLADNEISFSINPEYHEKLMKVCPSKKKIPLDDALDKNSAHIGILPFLD